MLQGNSQTAGGETPPQLGYPLLNGFRGVGQLAPLDLAGAFDLESPGMSARTTPLSREAGCKAARSDVAEEVGVVRLKMVDVCGPPHGDGRVDPNLKIRPHDKRNVGLVCRKKGRKMQPIIPWICKEGEFQRGLERQTTRAKHCAENICFLHGLRTFTQLLEWRPQIPKTLMVACS